MEPQEEQSPNLDFDPVDQADPVQAIAEAAPVAIAPMWHTALLMAGILALSIAGSSRLTARHGGASRLFTYGSTAAMELVMLGWVALGLRLRKIPMRTLFGRVTGGIGGVAQDLVVAFVFWICSMMILGSLGLVWTTVEFKVTHRGQPMQAGTKIEASESQKQTVRGLAQLAPENGKEIACWVLLCCVAGFVEEAVFRGYLQHQFTAWAHGSVAVGVLFSALMFGAAHGYQGVRNMVLLGVFGVLFSMLAIFRRNLRPGIFAHGGHDLFAGLVLAYARAHHLV